MKISQIAALPICLSIGAGSVHAKPTSTTPQPAKMQAGKAKSAPRPHKPLQATVAAKTAQFGTITKTSPLYKNALDAHALDKAKQQIGKNGAFKGTVSKVFEQPSGNIIILDFDPKYKTALTAVIKNPDYPKFPVVKMLMGKQIVVSGKFVDFHGAAEIVLTSPDQVKLVK